MEGRGGDVPALSAVLVISAGEIRGEKASQDLQQMQPQVLWTLKECLERRRDKLESLTLRNQPAGLIHDGNKCSCPLREPELPGRWEGALRFQGADGKGGFMALWAVRRAGNNL